MRTRRVVLLVGLAAVLGLAGYAAYRSPWVRSWFAHEGENTAEIGKLAGKKLEVPPAANSDVGWPQWRGPNRDGRAPAGPLRTDWGKNPPKRLWSTPCSGSYSSCAVVGGRVYTQDFHDGTERVVCLDAETGKLLWEYLYQADYSGTDRTYAIGPRATPSVVGDRVYAVGGAGKLLCIQAPAAAGGQPMVAWQHDLMGEFEAKAPNWGVACSPLIEGDLIIVQPGGKGGSVVAFDRNTGEQRWAAGTDPSGYSSPVAATVGGQRVIFALTQNALVAIRAADGKLTDSYPWKPRPEVNAATPLVVDDYVFISSAYSQGCALLRADVQGDGVKFVEVYARRRPPRFQNQFSTSVYKDHFLYGFDGSQNDARLKRLNFDTGKEKEDWEEAGIGPGAGTIILADKHLVIQTQRGDLCLVEATPEEFRLVAKVPRVLTGRNNWATP